MDTVDDAQMLSSLLESGAISMWEYNALTLKVRNGACLDQLLPRACVTTACPRRGVPTTNDNCLPCDRRTQLRTTSRRPNGAFHTEAGAPTSVRETSLPGGTSCPHCDEQMPPLMLDRHVAFKHTREPIPAAPAASLSREQVGARQSVAGHSAASAAQKPSSRRKPFVLGICAALATVSVGGLVLHTSGAMQLGDPSKVSAGQQISASDTGFKGTSGGQEEQDRTCQDVVETASGGYVCADGVPEAERHLLDEGGPESSGELHEITVLAAMHGDCGFIMQREVLVYDGFEELVGSGRYTDGDYDEAGRCIASAVLEVPFRNIYSIRSETFNGGMQYLMSVTWRELEANDFVAG